MTTVQGSPRWRRWLPRVVAVAVLVAAGVVLLVRLDVLGASAESSESSAQERSAAVTAELTGRMRTILEQMPPQQHKGHGAHTSTAGAQAKTVCGVRVYGYEPAAAATADEVVTLYGFHLCGQAEPGREWQWATKLVAPLVMRLDTRPPTVEMAEATAEVTYRDRVKQLIPPQHQKLALEGALTPDEMADLRRRYDAAAGV